MSDNVRTLLASDWLRRRLTECHRACASLKAEHFLARNVGTAKSAYILCESILYDAWGSVEKKRTLLRIVILHRKGYILPCGASC